MKRTILLFTAALLLSMASAFAQGGTTGPLTWKINNGTLTISGEGAMPDYYWDVPIPWSNYKDDIHTVVIEKGVTSIGLFAFSYFTNLTSVSISNTVLRIETYAFLECISLPSITFPDELIRIAGSAFSSCKALSSVIIPKGVTIFEVPFAFCYSLTSIEVDSENNSFSSEDGVLFNKDKTALISCPAGKQGAYAIPNSVKAVDYAAFYSCAGLTAVTIPNSVTDIGISAFSFCSALTSITIPNSVTSMGYDIFYSCTSLNSVTIPNSITRIGENTFRSCTNLIFIEIPNSITSIGERAFRDCTNLTSVIIPNGVTSIESSTFTNCTSLTSITIPNSVTSIRGNAFNSCTSLASIIIPNKVTDIDAWVFANCKKMKLITNLNPVPANIDNTVFDGMNPGTCTLEVPMNSVSAYKEANVWKKFMIKGIDVGIEPFETGVVKIFPNPTTGELRIENGELRIESLEVFDIYGRKHEGAKGRRDEGTNVINISELPAGIYFVKVCTENGVFIEKFIKN